MRARYSRGDGFERARQHIAEAEALSLELGGTDADVKEYFYGLQGTELKRILDEYERQFGAKARAYAEETMPRWRSGHRKMSGLVAGRLFGLLPRFMPLNAKYRLVESLWKQHGPRSNSYIEVGPDASPAEVLSSVRDRIGKLIVAYRIPDQLQRRFTWLSDGDAVVRQDLLNKMQSMERDLVEQGLAAKLPVFLGGISDQGAHHIQKLDQVIEVGNHVIRAAFRPDATGVRWTEEPAADVATKPVTSEEREGLGCLVLVAVVVAIGVLRHCSQG